MAEGLAAVRSALMRKNLNVDANEWRNSVALTGHVSSWEQYMEAGYAAAGKGYEAVVNDLTVEGVVPFKPSMPEPQNPIDPDTYFDAVVIGGGVIGSAIARELTRWDITVALLEKENDLAMQTSSRNDGMVHPPFAVTPGSKKAHYNQRGNKMFAQTARELGVSLEWPGMLMLFSNPWQRAFLPAIWQRIKQNEVCGAEFWNRQRVFKMEPNITADQHGGVFLPDSGIVSPYQLTVAFGENAVQNGAIVLLNTVVTGFQMEHNRITHVCTNRGLIQAGVVINAAGVWSDVVASYANDRFFTIHGRKGTAAILDRKVGHTQRTILSQPRFASHSHTKGGGLVPTIDGNLLLGPTAVEVPEREDYSTNASALEFVFDHHLKLNKSLKRSDIITYFSGVRACTFEEDFVIKTSDYVANLVHAAGIQSPGLASSPAIAQDVALLAVKALAAVAGRAIQPNAAFDPCRKAPPDLRGMSLEERAALIRRNPSYGRIICRCECISEGEILNTIHSLVPVQSLDGIKRRARAGMGRCQGGFCTPLLLEIMAREQQINIAEICKSGGHSEIALQPTKNAAVDCASEGAGSAALALSAANNSRRQEDYNAG